MNKIVIAVVGAAVALALIALAKQSANANQSTVQHWIDRDNQIMTQPLEVETGKVLKIDLNAVSTNNVMTGFIGILVQIDEPESHHYPQLAWAHISEGLKTNDAVKIQRMYAQSGNGYYIRFAAKKK